VITADAGLRGGKMIPLKKLVDEAISMAKLPPKHVLPKTRSGKILRRAILAVAEGKDAGDLSTLEDP
jgi:propionyl-CoA synthetase